MSKDHFQTFRYPSENYWLDKGRKVHTFQRVLSYFKRKRKEKKESGVFCKGWGGGRRTIFRLLGMYLSENYWLHKWWKVHTFQRVLSYFKRKKRKKKNSVFSKARSGGLRTIFRHLGILPKIIDQTNGERCILFKRVWRTLNEKNI